MAKGQMRNPGRYKTDNSGFDEFGFQKHQDQIAEQHHESELGDQQHDAESGQLIPGIPPQAQARRVKQITKKAHQLVLKRAKQHSPAQPAKAPAKPAKTSATKSRKVGGKKPALKTTTKKTVGKTTGKKKPGKGPVKKAAKK
jgi:hypothetical protein